MSQALADARILDLLRRWAEDFGMPTHQGIQVFVSAAGLARRTGVDEPVVQALLARLRRLGIVAPLQSHFLLVKDLPRLGDFARLAAERNGAEGETEGRR